MKLFDWQVPLADHMYKQLSSDNRVFLCAATTGAGKTFLSADVVKRLDCPVLIICPKVARTQWRRVLEDFGVTKVVDVINPEQISKPTGCKYYTRKDLWHLPVNTLVIVDEIHKGCSGPDSVLTKAIAGLKAYKSIKLLALSATPFDSPIKTRALGYWFGFHSYNTSSFHNWCRQHGCSTRVIGWGRTAKTIFTFTNNTKSAQFHMTEIRKAMGENFLAIGPDDIPNFPEEIREVNLIDLAAKDHDALTRTYEEMPKKYFDLSEEEMVRTLKLREQAEFCKAEAIAELAVQHEADGLSVFIMVNFTDARKRIENYLDKCKVKYASIYGGQKDSERQKGIDDFQNNEVHIIIGMASACSVALSLHDEKHERLRVSLISPGYSSSEFLQGLGRIRRAGGTFATQKIILAAQSVEERVAKAVNRKLDNLTALVDDDLRPQ